MAAVPAFMRGAFDAGAFDDATFQVRLSTTVAITLGGVDVTTKVRRDALSIRDILNDAPNTAAITFDGKTGLPQPGSPVRISVPPVVLFAGSLQTIDRSYEGKGTQRVFPSTAIDDTARANRRRPFGTWTNTSASTVGAALATFAPGFTTAIQAGLPAVTVTFDGSEPLIACLVRVANLIGGYAKIEDNTVYLFRTDTTDPPDPIDVEHPPLDDPPITKTVDVSQLRTRVFGKGYGERVPTDVGIGETLVPITDGVQFTPTGGSLIAGTTADGATHQRLGYTGVALSVGGTLVGPGAAPGNAPTLALAVGTGVTSGVHDVSVVHVTAAGKSLAGPVSSITVGALAGPTAAPVAGTALTGTGPDQGSHDYVVTFEALGGETVGSPVSNAISTSAASGQIAPPGAPSHATASSGAGADDGQHSYAVTFTNATGETQVGAVGAYITVAPQLVGQLSPPFSAPTLTASIGAGVGAGVHTYTVTFGDAYGNTTQGPSSSITAANGGEIPPPTNFLTATAQSGGSLTVGLSYWWKVAFGNAAGETTLGPYSNGGSGVTMGAGQGSAALINIPTGPAGTTRRLIYRERSNFIGAFRLVATINDNTTTTLTDALADASATVAPPGSNTTSVPYHVINLTNVPIGPSGTTNRKIWRDSGGGAKYVGEVSGNLTTVYTDTLPTASLGANAPTSNTTGQMLPFNQITVDGIAIGPAGTTGRKLYRSYYGGALLLVASLSNNTQTSYLDTKSNAALGAVAPTSNTTGTAVQRIPLTGIPLGPVGTTTGRKIYRRFNGAGTFKLVTLIANNTTTTYTDSTPNSGLGAAAPGAGTAVGNQIALSAIPTGAAAVTAREIYMSPAGGGTRRLALTITDNVTTTGTLTMSDATLAGQITEPGADTSGLQQPSGQVNPGSSTLILAASAPFSPTGGWATLSGGQSIRYTGISGQYLTGIPATGPGAIAITVIYGQQARPAPMLTGVTGITQALAKGAAIHIWIQRDDLAAQAEQAARDGSDGIVEFLLVDERRSEPSLITRCDADLALFSRPIVTVTYATRDLRTRSGKPVTINLPSPAISETLTIQDVAITEIDIAAGLPPKFTVTASSVRFSLEDTLRRLVGTVGPE